MKFTQLQKVIAEEIERNRVEEANGAFERMSPEQKRVQIAQDVLDHLATKRVIAAHGQFLSAGNYFVADRTQSERELRDIMREAPVCRACALGSLMLATLERADDFKAGDLADFKTRGRDDGARIYDEDVVPYLARFFDMKTIGKAEVAFEAGVGAIRTDLAPGTFYRPKFSDIITKDEYDVAKAYGLAVAKKDEYDFNAKRLTAIMRNIVRNNGDFKPEQGVVEDDLAPLPTHCGL